MNSICLYPHPSSKNHGCEAIAIATSNIFDNSIKNSKKILLTKYEKNDEKFGEDKVCNYYDNTYKCVMPHLERGSLAWIKYQLMKHTGKIDSVDILAKDFENKHIDMIKDIDMFVSIGGDNYCYGRPTALYAVHKALINNKKKTVLWGCSIEPNAIDKEMIKDLSMYNKIFARESLTFDALKKAGLDNVELYPDPAFTLLKEQDNQNVPDNTVGINISPLIMNYTKNSDMVRQAFVNMVKKIMENTIFNVMFIPHVTANTTDDRIEIESIYKELKEFESRIFIAEERDCCKIKDVISKCRFFIGARTHATIAAYSTCVPTMVCGYSVKAKGIAKDLFGTHNNYVVPVESITVGDELYKAFSWIMDNEMEIKNRLNEVMPRYIEKAWEAGEIINNVFEK